MSVTDEDEGETRKQTDASAGWREEMRYQHALAGQEHR